MTDIPARIMEEAKEVVRSLGLYFEGDGYIALTRRDIRKIATALLAAEQRARKEALEEAAATLDAKAEVYEEDGRDVRLPTADRLFAGAVAVRLRGSAATIRALANEKEG